MCQKQRETGMSDKAAVVIDNGSSMIKVGLAGEDEPKAFFPAVVGLFQSKDEKEAGLTTKFAYVGFEAEEKKEILSIKHPIERRVVVNHDDMEKIWWHAYVNALDMLPEDQAALIIEPPMNPKENRSKATQIMFESLGVPALYLANSAVLALFVTGKTTGVIVDSGYSVTHIVPIYQEFSVPYANLRMDFGGKDLTSYMIKLFHEQSCSFGFIGGRECVRKIKKSLTYVAEDFDQEMKRAELDPSAVNVEYELPDKRVINVGTERFRCPEVLFDPVLVGWHEGGLHQTIYTSIQKAEIDMRKELFSNILLCGGNSMFKGLDVRLQKELKKLAPPGTNVCVNAPENRHHLVWIGGSVLASLPRFESMCMTKAEYQEFGSSIVFRKC
jgi:actin-related protein